MSPVRTAPANLSRGDAALRAEYLREVLALLYPGEPGSGAEFLVIPDNRRPRLLVPAHDRRLAAAAVARYAEPQTRLARLKRNAVVAALRTGASHALLRDRVRVPGGAGTIESYLRDQLDQPVHLSVHIGPARANRKPVLQLLLPDGRTLGFAKLGTNELTRELVRAETTALVALASAGLREIQVPRVLHAGQWNGHEVLVQQALPVWEPRADLDPQRCARAMREVAGSCGTTRVRLAGSPYWATLGARLAAITGHHEGHQLGRAARRIGTAAGDVELRFGAWHGDWAPWNMRPLAASVLVWDWERFTTGVPLGFDALHLDLQRRVSEMPDGAAAVAAMLAEAPVLLQPFGVVNAAAVRLTALLYLIDLAARYVADRQADAGARLGVLGSWLLPVLLARVEEL